MLTRPVRICLLVRRFRCHNPSCKRKIFAERLLEIAPRARETKRLAELLGIVGYEMGGNPGARLLKQLGMPGSPDTVLRRLKARLRGYGAGKVRVLGVDDWAWRKRQRYGTMLMDMERNTVIDLLPDRSAESFASWLGSHPEVEIITRDRSSLYADGGRKGARSAVQITDRFHLVSNLSEAAEHDLQQLQTKARRELTKSKDVTGSDVGGSRKLTLVEARYQRCRNARYQRYLAVLELRRQGHTQEAIGEKMGMSPDTVARWLNAPEFPERRIRSDRQRDRARFLQHCVRGLHPLQARLHYSTGRVAALLNKPPRRLSEPQQKYLQAFLRFCPEGHQLRRLLLRFRAMLRWRNATRLSEWIESAAASRFPFLAQFGKNLLRDWDAVERSITTPWNNGAIEGHINRLKAIKRQMYGRAGFELLKARVLPWILPAAA